MPSRAWGFLNKQQPVPGLHGVQGLQAQPPQAPVLPGAESSHANPGRCGQEHESETDFPRSQSSRLRAGAAKTSNECETIIGAPPTWGHRLQSRHPTSLAGFLSRPPKGFQGGSPSQQPALGTPSMPSCVSPPHGGSHCTPHSHNFNASTSHCRRVNSSSPRAGLQVCHAPLWDKDGNHDSNTNYHRPTALTLSTSPPTVWSESLRVQGNHMPAPRGPQTASPNDRGTPGASLLAAAPC